MLYTAFPPTTTFLLRIYAYASFASPLAWPWQCLRSSSSTVSSSLGSSTLLPLNYWTIMSLWTTLPFLVFLIATTAYSICYELFFLAANRTQRGREQQTLTTWYATGVVSVYLLMIGGVAESTLGSFRCVDVDPQHTSAQSVSVLWYDLH